MSAAQQIGYEESRGTAEPLTLFDKIWRDHVVHQEDDGTTVVYIDRHLVHEVTSPQAFEGLRLAGRKVRRPDCTLVTVDHNIPTDSRANFKDIGSFIKESDSRLQVSTLEDNVKEFGLAYFGMTDDRQGIVHVIGPEQGFTLPGTTLVCGDSHTSTHGAFGSLAFGIGTSEVEHVLATQTLIMKPALNMRIAVNGKLSEGVTSKDVILHIIGLIGTAGGTGHVIEYCGNVIQAFSMEARMSMCNMTIEAGARAGLVAPDAETFAYLKGRPLAPKGSAWDQAVNYWKSLPSDKGAKYDKEVSIDAADITPTVTWGTSPENVVPITGCAPDPATIDDKVKREAAERMLSYMGIQPGQKMTELAVDKVFIGSCTNSRIEDLRSAAAVARGQKVADGIEAMVVPGSGLVKAQAEAENLHEVFKEAGFDWREPGCSMCLGMNPDRLKPHERCASTSNRNFEGRQGPQGRTHLMSPAMAAAAAIKGKLADVREFVSKKQGKSAADKSTAQKSQRDSKEFCKKVVALPAWHAESNGAASGPEGVPSAEASLPASGMPTFTRLDSVVAAPLRKANVDTDCIIPKQFLKTIKRTGLGKSAFFELRYEDDGETEIPGFVLNQDSYRSAQVLVALDNFGCGSSREHAPWALNDFGIRCIIAPSFADIFRNNCFKNSMLPVALPADQVEVLMTDAEAKKNLTVDLNEQKIVRENGEAFSFEVDAFQRDCLLKGLDDIGLTMQKQAAIAKFEVARGGRYPWLDNRAGDGVAEIRVTGAKASSFYTHIAKGFIDGLPATEDRPERPPASKVTFSATGAAIERAVRAAAQLQTDGIADIAGIRTDYVSPPSGGDGSGHLPQVVITMNARPKARAIVATGQSNAAVNGEDATKNTDW
eukprot:TRINITY_DN25381_c0_g1_i1.p1 TRINITY_DN25381_c0_g1~~TRINITY_DN25381_c0_g1_i1.p1  ORF type:complete len:909 (-),score=123.96 TRINITY_DN25381_c0_g1_i1:221-2863(-)